MEAGVSFIHDQFREGQRTFLQKPEPIIESGSLKRRDPY